MKLRSLGSADTIDKFAAIVDDNAGSGLSLLDPIPLDNDILFGRFAGLAIITRLGPPPRVDGESCGIKLDLRLPLSFLVAPRVERRLPFKLLPSPVPELAATPALLGVEGPRLPGLPIARSRDEGTRKPPPDPFPSLLPESSSLNVWFKLTSESGL